MRKFFIFTSIGLGAFFTYKINYCENIYCDLLKIMFKLKLKRLANFKYKCSCVENFTCCDCWVRNCNKNNF